jgi:hypothetical protein
MVYTCPLTTHADRGTEATAALSSVVPATTVADWAHADRGNRGQSSALTCRVRHHSGSIDHADLANRGQKTILNCRDRHHGGWLSPRRPREQARAAPSPVVPATTVAGWAHADQASRGQSSALNDHNETYAHFIWRVIFVLGCILASIGMIKLNIQILYSTQISYIWYVCLQ